MMVTSAQIAREAPGLPLGLPKVQGWKRKACQLFFGVCSPITIIMLHLQHQITSEKVKKIQSLQNELLFEKFTKLNSLLTALETQRIKSLKNHVAFELSHEMFIGILMVLFSISRTKTTSGTVYILKR